MGYEICFAESTGKLIGRKMVVMVGLGLLCQGYSAGDWSSNAALCSSTVRNTRHNLLWQSSPPPKGTPSTQEHTLHPIAHALTNSTRSNQ